MMHSVLRMSRSTTLVKPVLLRGRVSVASQQTSSTIKRYSHQSYGGDDNPHGDRPGSRKSRELEHPGPPPPKTREISADTGAEIKTEAPSQKRKEEEDLYHKKQPSNKAHPTLSTGRESPNVDEQGNTREDVPEDVKRHNQELSQRYDKSYNRIADGGKVSKGFWEGSGGSLSEDKSGVRRDGGH